MATSDGIEIIALEEHYWDTVITDNYSGPNSTRRGPILDRLYDLHDLRIKEMDQSGIDIQVLSHGAPSAQRLDEIAGPMITQKANNKYGIKSEHGLMTVVAEYIGGTSKT